MLDFGLPQVPNVELGQLSVVFMLLILLLRLIAAGEMSKL